MTQVLLGIAVFLIVVGVILAIIGVVLDPGPQQRRADGTPPPKPSFMDVMLELIKKCFKIITDDAARRFQKLAALGMMLVYLGLAFLLAAGAAGLFGSGGDDEPSDDPSSPSTSTSSTQDPGQDP